MTQRRMRARTAVIVVLGLAAALPLMARGVDPAGAAAPARDGSSADLAAPSCWAIKQDNPAAADGAYWLQTPALGAPQRFYCDMTTDGGGWILIGRGRNGWSFEHTGQRTAANVVDTPTGTGAFAPAALPADTVDALLNGVPVRDVPDGVRIRRARNATGTTWQDVRWDFRHLEQWSWGFGGGMILDSTRIDGTSYVSGNTRDSMARLSGQESSALNGVNNDRRLFTYAWQSHGWQAGFSYGSGVNGTNNSTSYLWQNASEGHALPFTQVFIRPRTTEADVSYAALPDAGLPAETLRPLMQNTTEGGSAPWGVTGYLATSGTITAEDVEVLALEQIGNTVFVGGKFRYVQRGTDTTTRVEQRYLAAFDATTGAWISGFRPVVDGPIWDMSATPDGKLIIGGEFLNVNGAFSPGLAALNPVTGATASGWNALVTKNGSTTTRPLVRAMDLRGDWLYVGGDFNRATGGAHSGVVVGKAARFRWTDGQVDWGWKPNFSAQIIDLSVDENGERVYFAGYFLQAMGQTVQNVAVVTTSSPPQLIPWQWTPSASKGYQQAILARDGRVYHGGSEHNIDGYVVNGTAAPTLVARNITKQGGDFQAVALVDGVLYAACHCADFNYADTMTWSATPNPSRTDRIRFVGAYDAETMEPIPDFLPVMGSRTGDGPWDLLVASNGCLWVGGDMNSGSGGAWAGGFTRYCPRDSVAPTSPTNLTSTVTDGNVTLRWNGSSDNRSAVRYEVFRDDRVIATVGGTSFTDPGRTEATRYAVRAVDTSGNKSATTPVLTVTPPAAPIGTYVAAGSTWSYFAGSAAPAGWNTRAFDHSSWAAGPAPLGWNEADLATVVPSSGPTSYYVRRFEVSDPSAVGSLLIRLRRDDGAVVYVNGVEVARSAMEAGFPPGPVTYDTLVPYTWGADETRFFEHVAPAYPLVAGTNVIAVEVHQAQPNNADASFDLELIGNTRSASDTTAPTTPGLSVSRTGPLAASLSWSASSDAGGVLGYRIQRNGTDVAFVAAPATSFADGGLAPGTTYTYAVRAVDGSANQSAASTASFTTDGDPNLLAYGSTWRWRYDHAAPAADWNQPGFDDTAWAAGPGELGFNDGDEATVIPAGSTPRPMTAHFRSTFTIGDPSRIAGIDLDVIRDDGVVVYVNGVEIGRDNMPAGPVDHTTPASTGLWDRAPEVTPVRMVVPPSVLVAGVNVIAVEIHQSDAWSGDLSMAVKAVARFV